MSFDVNHVHSTVPIFTKINILLCVQKKFLKNSHKTLENKHSHSVPLSIFRGHVRPYKNTKTANCVFVGTIRTGSDTLLLSILPSDSSFRRLRGRPQQLEQATYPTRTLLGAPGLTTRSKDATYLFLRDDPKSLMFCWDVWWLEPHGVILSLHTA